MEHIADKDGGMGCKTLFATHYHELTDLEKICIRDSCNAVRGRRCARRRVGQCFCKPGRAAAQPDGSGVGAAEAHGAAIYGCGAVHGGAVPAERTVRLFKGEFFMEQPHTREIFLSLIHI